MKQCHHLQTLHIPTGTLPPKILVDNLVMATRLSTLLIGHEMNLHVDTAMIILSLCPSLKSLECHNVIGKSNQDSESWTADLSNLETLKLLGRNDPEHRHASDLLEIVSTPLDDRSQR